MKKINLQFTHEEIEILIQESSLIRGKILNRLFPKSCELTPEKVAEMIVQKNGTSQKIQSIKDLREYSEKNIEIFPENIRAILDGVVINKISLRHAKDLVEDATKKIEQVK